MNLSLEGKTALVCGSSQGIGAAIAVELAQLGANCILLARSEEKLKGIVAGLQTNGIQKHQYVSVDFNDQEATQKQVQKILSSGAVHILINNSGGPAAGPITDATADQFLQAFHQHLLTNHMLVQAVIPGMKEARYGRIINVISTSVKIPLKNLGVSNTIRGAVASWAKTLANELGQFNITVNNVLPGSTNTERLSSLIENTAKRQNSSIEEVKKRMQDEVPMKRFGEASEIAAVAAFLASPAASYVNGTSIPVDGGRTGSL